MSDPGHNHHRNHAQSIRDKLFERLLNKFLDQLDDKELESKTILDKFWEQIDRIFGKDGAGKIKSALAEYITQQIKTMTERNKHP